MTVRKHCHFSIREFKLSDQHVVTSLIRFGILEHIYPAFFRAMSHVDHVGVALSVSMAGYVLGGSSTVQALLFGAAWAGLVYFCCHEIYAGYMLRRLSTDMANIHANYLESPNCGFWVAQANVNGQAEVVGALAVRGWSREAEGGGSEKQNGRMGEDAEDGGYGHVSHLVVEFPWRRHTLGTQLTQKALDFCRERGLSRLIVELSSPQSAAASMFEKLGFVQMTHHSNTHANRWISKVARIHMIQMEKFI